MLKGG